MGRDPACCRMRGAVGVAGLKMARGAPQAGLPVGDKNRMSPMRENTPIDYGVWNFLG